MKIAKEKVKTNIYWLKSMVHPAGLEPATF
jgi:hypothetical protein